MKDEIFYTPFYSAFLKLCDEAGKTPSAVAKEAEISSGAPTAWKRGAVPKPAQREKLCAYFGVSDDVLLGYKQKTPSTAEGEGLSVVQLEALNFIKTLTDEQLRRFIAMGKAAFEKGE